MRFVVFSAGIAGRTSDIASIRRVLDAVAERIGDAVWYARMSDAMLKSVHKALARNIPTRKAFVIAYEVRGFSRKRMRVLFSIGKRGVVNENNEWIVARRRTPPRHAHPNKGDVHGIKRAAYLAGLFHDIGKNTRHFQEKIKNGKIISDPVRHEVLSVSRLTGCDEPERWRLPVNDRGESFSKNPGQNGGIEINWPLYLVLSHHRLPSINSHDGTLDLIRAGHVKEGDMESEVVENALPARSPRSMLISAPQWSNVASLVYSRLALMMADHYVSSLRQDKAGSGALDYVVKRLVNPDGAKVLANRHQSLEGHLKAIGRLARSLAPRLLNGAWMAGMPSIASERLLSQAGTSGPFEWQSKAVRLVRTYRDEARLEEGLPGLVLVGARTGTGKTRACAAIAAALSGYGARITTALGLRTLTLQTYRSYRDELELSEEEVSFVIGSQAYKEMQDRVHNIDDESSDEEVYLSFDEWSGVSDLIPPVGAQLKNAAERRFLYSPVAVCTIDQIIKAADHHRSGWIKPWLRIQSSSALIIDEVDGFGLEDTPALLRLIYFSAIAGTHVVVSSATLYPALAKRICNAYESGLKQRAAMLGVDVETARFTLVADIEDASQMDSVSEFDGVYRRFAAKLEKVSGDDERRKFQVIKSPELGSSIEEAQEVLIKKMFELHKNTCLAVETDGGQTKLSIGMAKLLHVKNVIALAQRLDKWIAEHPDNEVMVRVLVYHSRNTMLGRSYIEWHLDQMLKRKNNRCPTEHEPVRRLASEAARQGKEAMIIVVTTLEEVGQDHDYDWAIIEPASARSIVQTAGRVLRHRTHRDSDSSNILIMETNFRGVENPGAEVVFTRPGFESKNLSYPKPVIFQGVSSPACISPKKGALGHWDNLSIDSYLQTNIDGWLASKLMPLSCDHYMQHGFRGGILEDSLTVKLFDEPPCGVLECRSAQEESFIEVECVTLLPHTSFFTYSLSEVLETLNVEEGEINDDHMTINVFPGSQVAGVDPLYGVVLS